MAKDTDRSLVHNTTHLGYGSYGPDEYRVAADFSPRKEASAHICVRPVTELMKYNTVRIQRANEKPSVVWWENK
jgi:hypothetical protein